MEKGNRVTGSHQIRLKLKFFEPVTFLKDLEPSDIRGGNVHQIDSNVVSQTLEGFDPSAIKLF